MPSGVTIKSFDVDLDACVDLAVEQPDARSTRMELKELLAEIT